MKNFDRGSGGYESRGRGGDRGFDRGGRGGRGFDKPMFPATCAECGERCQVPFRPTGDKPVLCNNCFRKDDDRGFRPQRPQRSDDRFSRDERPQRDNKMAEQFEQLNAKLDMIMKEIEKLKSPKMIHMVESQPDLDMAEISTKKAKKAKKEDVEEVGEVMVDEKAVKKAAKKAAKKAK